MGWFGFKTKTPAVVWSLDIESTGLDIERDHILSIGMVPIRDRVIHWGDRAYWLIRPPDGVDGESAATPIHQLLPDELAGATPLSAVLPEIARRLEGAKLGEARSKGIGLLVHWAKLDVGLLRRAFREAGLKWPDPQVIDTIDWIAQYDRRRRVVDPNPRPTPTQLSQARAAFGLPPHDEHHALYDALATAELLLVLQDRLG